MTHLALLCFAKFASRLREVPLDDDEVIFDLGSMSADVSYEIINN